MPIIEIEEMSMSGMKTFLFMLFLFDFDFLFLMVCVEFSELVGTVLDIFIKLPKEKQFKNLRIKIFIEKYSKYSYLNLVS